MLFLTGYCLESTGWLSELHHVTVLILLGGILGLLLGQSQFSYKLSLWMILILSIEFVSWQLVFSAPVNISWAEKSLLFFNRVYHAIVQMTSNQPLKDGILFVAVMSILYWIIGFGAGFSLTRNGKPWLFISIAGIMVIIIQLFQPVVLRNQILSGLFWLLLVILWVRIRYLSVHQAWAAANVAEDQTFFSVSFRIAFITALTLILISWNAPFLIKIATPGTKEQLEFRKKIADFWQSGRNFFNPLKQRENYIKGGIGDFLALSATRSTQSDLLFTIKTTRPNRSGIPYYWRGRIFEKYQNGIWTNGDIIEEIIPKNGIIQNLSSDLSENIKFLITPSNDQFQIYFPAEPVMVDQEITVLKRAGQIENEVIAIFPNQYLIKGKLLMVISSIRNYYLANLASADESYPQWIYENYLQLPEIDLSKIRTLAKNITEGKTSVLEKVKAITQYLRSNFTYSDSVPDLPFEKIDLIEWFLFMEKSGFCTYFASAEVILLRTLGIPSRLAVGYSQGEVKNDGTEFAIREKDNHAWPEVYFHNIGWVPFEPTPSQPNIDYETIWNVTHNSENESSSGLPSLLLDAGGSTRLNRWERTNDEENPLDQNEMMPTITKQNPFLYLLLITVLLSGIFWFVQKNLFKRITFPSLIAKQLNRMGFKSPKWLSEWDKYIKKTNAEKMFTHVDVILNFFGVESHPSFSARQRSDILVHLIPDAMKDINILLNQYEIEKYRERISNIKAAKIAVKRIWKHAIRVRLNNKIESLKKNLFKFFQR